MTPDFYINRFGANYQAVRPDGWVLAECSRTGDLFNGSHDGTDAGKAAFNSLITEHQKTQ